MCQIFNYRKYVASTRIYFLYFLKPSSHQNDIETVIYLYFTHYKDRKNDRNQKFNLIGIFIQFI
ncbi:hypothetical protein BSSX_p20017 (plasmid) [Bacillus subtilis]|nr:hypothetical protein BSSX_p20006 [Bacillus subtilis]ASK26333.1 hypothetical protein BSSX_p20017 [Bacillus subtilis]